MNQDSSFPPILPPSTELGALLFAILPCLQDSYRPLAAFAYHMTELSKLKSFPSVPPLTNLRSVETLISDKDAMLHSLTFYGKMFHMPLLSTIANLLRTLQFYNTYKDLLPGLLSAMNGSGSGTPSVDSIAGLLSGLDGLGGGTDLFSALGALSPGIFSSLFSDFSGTSARDDNTSVHAEEDRPEPIQEEHVENAADENTPENTADGSFDLYDSLYSFLTPEQKEIYEQLMNTD